MSRTSSRPAKTAAAASAAAPVSVANVSKLLPNVAPAKVKAFVGSLNDLYSMSEKQLVNHFDKMGTRTLEDIYEAAELDPRISDPVARKALLVKCVMASKRNKNVSKNAEHRDR
jgi:hypothetical protein